MHKIVYMYEKYILSTVKFKFCKFLLLYLTHIIEPLINLN